MPAVISRIRILVGRPVTASLRARPLSKRTAPVTFTTSYLSLFDDVSLREGSNAWVRRVLHGNNRGIKTGFYWRRAARRFPPDSSAPVSLAQSCAELSTVTIRDRLPKPGWLSRIRNPAVQHVTMAVAHVPYAVQHCVVSDS